MRILSEAGPEALMHALARRQLETGSSVGLHLFSFGGTARTWRLPHKSCGVPGDTMLGAGPLFEIQLRVAARPGHPLAGRRDLRELAKCAWLAQARPGAKADVVVQFDRRHRIARPAAHDPLGAVRPRGI